MEKECEEEEDDDDDDDDDDDCSSVISYHPNLLSQREKCFKDDSDTCSLEGKIEIQNVSSYTNQLPKTGIGLEENEGSEMRELSSQEPHYISHLETSSHLDDLCSKFAFMQPLEDDVNINYNVLEGQDENETGSSLPSPPPPFEVHENTHAMPVEGNDRVIAIKKCSKSENCEREEYLEEEQVSVFKDKENNFSVTCSSSPMRDKNISNLDEIVSPCIERKVCEKDTTEVTTSSKEVNKLSTKVIRPSAVRVCQAQAEVLLSKFCRPWIDLDTDEVPKCCETGPTDCYSFHGKKELCPEESEFYDEFLLWRMDNGSSAIDLIQSRLNGLVFPTTSVLQNLLYGCMELWVEGISEAMIWLRHLLKLHPPCAFGMLDYYRKVLFNPVKDMKAPDGIFWLCVSKIEEVINAIQIQIAENNAAAKTSSDQHESFDLVERFLESSLLQCEKEVHDIKPSNKLSQLFDTLDYLIRIMEADLNVGLLKNFSNLKRYTCKTGRPLIAVALWGTHGTVGNVNTKCRHLMKMYMKIMESYHDIKYHRYFRRLISLMAGVTYASERNSEPPKYPNIESNCRDLANAFASIMMATAINVTQVHLILESLSPDWFRVCVCSNLIEKLYGRNMELSLRPTVFLLKSLNKLNQVYPSDEEISKTLLAEPDSNKATTKDSEELPLNYVKQATKKDKRGETRLHIACRRNNIQEVERLLNVPDININEKDHMGWTPLHEAAFHGSLECVRCLLNFRTPSGGPAVDLEARSKGGVTPLMDAVSKNHLEVAFVLLQYGGQKLLSHENSEGFSVWDLARSDEMKRVLSNAQDHGLVYDLTIPRTLYVKLAVLTPLAIKYYIKFSEVTRIVNYLKYNTELTREGASSVKFHPIAFKQDYLEFKKLQSFLKEEMNNANRLLNTLDSFI
ncbi:hypothetical protein R5R35_008290 [Gryllus longicercus]|uniref:Uncharacterized protein n=1 Tax=Gryllus longicercus TaxID=2509291 RepID=A0AAN9VR35_9ORTH